MGKRGRPPKYKVEFVNGAVPIEESLKETRDVSLPQTENFIDEDMDKNFETTDKETAYKLGGKGFYVLEIKSPTADRREKLYIFKETKKQAEEALNG